MCSRYQEVIDENISAIIKTQPIMDYKVNLKTSDSLFCLPYRPVSAPCLYILIYGYIQLILNFYIQ